MDRDRRLTGYLRGQTDNPQAPPGFELNHPWRVGSLKQTGQNILNLSRSKNGFNETFTFSTDTGEWINAVRVAEMRDRYDANTHYSHKDVVTLFAPVSNSILSSHCFESLATPCAELATFLVPPNCSRNWQDNTSLDAEEA